MWLRSLYGKMGLGWTLASSLLLIGGNIEATVESVLQKIEIRACESQSDIVFIVRNGKAIAAFGSANQYKPVETRSITKSFVGLAIGMLIDEAKISSIDTPVYTFYPEWHQGFRQSVTIGHLLSHTSGIENGDEMCEIDTCDNIIRMALSTDFTNCPGTRFEYNNKATNLLAGIVQKAAGMNVQMYLRQKLFRPLGITSDSWLADSSGNLFGMSYLTINAIDLAKVGMLIAQGGYWNGEQLISCEWLTKMMQPSQEFNPFYSQLWWLDYNNISFYWDKALLDMYAEAGVSPTDVSILKILDGESLMFNGQISYRNYAQWIASNMSCFFGSTQEVNDCLNRIDALGLPIARWLPGELRTISARGFGGQQLIIMPNEGLVAVRLSSCSTSPYAPDTFPDLEALLGQLACELRASPGDIEAFRCEPEKMIQYPRAYRCEDDPEFRKPPCFPGTICPRDELKARAAANRIDISRVPYYTQPVIPYYKPPKLPERVLELPEEGALVPFPHEEQEGEESFGSAFEGATLQKPTPLPNATDSILPLKDENEAVPNATDSILPLKGENKVHQIQFDLPKKDQK